MAESTRTLDWNGANGDHWVAYEEKYNAAMLRYSERLFAGADVHPDDRVLDIGCGCGQTTRVAAALAAEGSALGVDLSAAMLAQARARAAEEGVGNVRFEQADAQVHDFDGGAYDVAISRHGVMFFADPLAAFANVRRALRPAGRLAFVCWRAPEESEYSAVPRAALRPYVTVPASSRVNEPGPNSLADPDRVREVLGGAGFVDVRLEAENEPMDLGAGVEEAVDFVLNRPHVQGAMADLDGTTKAKATESVREALTPYLTPEGVLLRAPAWLVTAHNAA
ncbi:class I SAM-dependent methyltransferase [Streptomyces sp. CMB-StM0423]|uniref:class I SAM-dependent methyltransferase n=1 Tax=Streptomyces sp. CMB-StM0423 TaxID=2059884 RepID=UPI000C70370A|nr:class I SAM-dependent methyltransferase [Streptomyces sp. CMB-StM0423]AUH43385.1 class I SAM-dependent methyltransferase [Streptomyces sp. CMB-StM0423]